MCMIDHAERIELIRESTPIARRQHKCCECGRVIKRGEKYEVVAGKSDGEFETYKTCRHCIHARDWLGAECGGWCYEWVREDLREHWDNDRDARTMELGRLIVGMRRQWARRDGALMRTL